MSEKKVLLTGSEGVIGKVLTGHTLSEDPEKRHLEADITRADARPARGSPEATELGDAYNKAAFRDPDHPFLQTDLADEGLLRGLLEKHDVVVHAALADEGILDPESHNPDNLELVKRILRVAVGLGKVAAPKIVLLSSVNAHVPRDWKQRREQGDLIDVDEPPTPHYHNRGGEPGPGFTRYGQNKIELEKLAEQYAREHGLDITVVRLGNVHFGDKLSSEYPPHVAVASSERGKHFDLDWEDAVRLRHRDLVAAIQELVDEDKREGHFKLTQLVSDSVRRVHKSKSD
jgi:nucleoside-diphosphate-sugar epimerase